MLSHATKALRRLKLAPMAERWEQWLADPANLDRSHEDLLCALTDAQEQASTNRRAQSVLRRANLSSDISVAGIRTGAARGLTAQALSNLCTCGWVQQGQNLIITGPSRAGKTYLMAALAQNAATQKYTIVHWRTPEFLEAYAVQRRLGTHTKLLRQAERADVLALDDFATEVATGEETNWLRRLIDVRRRQDLATVVVSPNAIEDWDPYFADQTAAEQIYGRLTEYCQRIDLKHSGAASTQRTRAKI